MENCFLFADSNMEKYIGNKKHIVDEIEHFILDHNINSRVFVDVFSGTTNVGQYFKQKGYSILSNDINHFSYVLENAYIVNNSFPSFNKLLKTNNIITNKYSKDKNMNDIEWIKKRIKNDKIFRDTYFNDVEYERNIEPLLMVLQYLNSLDVDNLNDEEMVFFNNYCKRGNNSSYVSLRKQKGKRNYFSSYNAKKLGKILFQLRVWYRRKLINKMELYILLTSILEEVTLIANVNGTFHDFNRKKLYPNALVKIHLKPIALNIYLGDNRDYHAFKTDSNKLVRLDRFKSKCPEESILYIDPPYNFRQYSSYYHLLNLISRYCFIENILDYTSKLEYVRGQNMKDNFDSQYCYKETFASSLEDLINTSESKTILISYYDENNHWNHGKKKKTEIGREVMSSILENCTVDGFYRDPFIMKRLNYQSQSGEHKKEIDELLYYAWRD